MFCDLQVYIQLSRYYSIDECNKWNGVSEQDLCVPSLFSVYLLLNTILRLGGPHTAVKKSHKISKVERLL